MVWKYQLDATGRLLAVYMAGMFHKTYHFLIECIPAV